MCKYLNELVRNILPLPGFVILTLAWLHKYKFSQNTHVRASKTSNACMTQFPKFLNDILIN